MVDETEAEAAETEESHLFVAELLAAWMRRNYWDGARERFARIEAW